MLASFCICICLAAEPPPTSRVWICFADKGIASESQRLLALAEQALRLSDRTRRRRELRRVRPGLVDMQDLPPAAHYVAAVISTGARLRRESRWLNAVSVEATPAQARAIAGLPFVREIGPVARGVPLSPVPILPGSGGPGPADNDPSFYGPAYDQLLQINAVDAHNAGYSGGGIVIGMLDTGFRRTHDCFNETQGPAHPIQVIDEYDFINNDDNTANEEGDPENQDEHGTQVLGALAAYCPEVLVGITYDASFLLAKTEDVSQEVPAEEDDYVAGLEWLEASGADLATSSIGYSDWYTEEDFDGQTAVTSIAVNVATANGMFCCTAAGNSGHDDDPETLHLIAPADAFQVLTVGAVTSEGSVLGLSSDGPSFDGRVKPEVLARGADVWTVHPDDDESLIDASGTSMSTPLAAGGVALVLQAHPDWTVDMVRRAVMHTASDFSDTGEFDAAFVRGYGIMNVMAAINFVHGDINGNGTADGRDIAPFLRALWGTNNNPDQVRRSDVNADAVVDQLDVPVFVEDLLRR